jgi:protein-S-isoprenylcysteine O-methyltransferase Ste14
MSLSLLKSILHNIGVLIVGLGFAYLGTRVDLLLGIRRFHSFLTTTAGWLLLIIGFLLRVWATFHFYQQRMKVISLVPQRTLITSGPYRFSRNPLYLGGNVFVFFGAALLLDRWEIAEKKGVRTFLWWPTWDYYLLWEEGYY